MNEDLTDTLLFLKEAGFDFVEVPMNSTDPAKWQQIGEQLAELGIGVQACSICGAEHNLISPDATVRREATDFLKQIVDGAALMGAPILMGPLFAGFKTFTGKPATEQEWEWSVTGMREVAEHAATKNVILAMEYLNRFETYLLTCTDDVIRYVEAVDHPNCRIAFDTFHANMEEKSIPDAIRACAPYLVHVQISENDRSTPGQGHINFTEIFDAFQEIGYTGPIAIEAFGPNPPELASATHIFRPMFDSPEQLATDGLEFIKRRKEERDQSAVAEGERVLTHR
jgi:D-psicose/D-tagatose/L-ribulose 3-epimerase